MHSMETCPWPHSALGASPFWPFWSTESRNQRRRGPGGTNLAKHGEPATPGPGHRVRYANNQGASRSPACCLRACALAWLCVWCVRVRALCAWPSPLTVLLAGVARRCCLTASRCLTSPLPMRRTAQGHRTNERTGQSLTHPSAAKLPPMLPGAGRQRSAVANLQTAQAAVTIG